MSIYTVILQIAAAGAAGAGIGVAVHWYITKSRGNAAAKGATKIKEDAQKEAEHILREAKVMAKSELLKGKEELEGEMRDWRKEQLTIEKRLGQREENLEKKADALEARMKGVDRKEKDLDTIRERIIIKEDELARSLSKQVDALEKVAQMSRDEAKTLILERIKGEAQNECGLLIRNILEEAKEKSEREAKKILIGAMQRYAADCTYERSTATIPLPNDEMKGRIIGREGRNIRALEAATGVSILIDDTPEAVVISCFDPVRKEIARQLLEKLISDGRIHPTRIEELVRKITKEVEEEVYSEGEKAVLETGLHGVQPQLIKLVGRLKFRFSFSQNVLQHSIETAYFMGAIAAELGLDEQKARRIGLLHDIGKAVDHEVEGSHAAIGADLLRKFNEAPDVINAVAAHHNETEANTVYGILANACDALSASRPGARSETTELYLKRLENLEKIANEFQGVENCFALQAGREVRIVVQPEKVDEGKAQMMAREICQRIENEMNYPGQIKVTVIRETRSVEYAK
jgi:ribonuclease Y